MLPGRHLVPAAVHAIHPGAAGKALLRQGSCQCPGRELVPHSARGVERQGQGHHAAGILRLMLRA